MEFSNVIAIFALVVSVISAWISYKAHRYSIDSKRSEMHRRFAREKSEFLVRIEKAQKLFERLDYQLKVLIQKIETTSQSVKASLTEEVRQLNSDLSYLDGCRRQAWSLWEETYEMKQDGFAHHQPRFLKLIEDDEEFADKSIQKLQTIEDTLKFA